MKAPQPQQPNIKTATVSVEFPINQLEALDSWIARSDEPGMSRPEAIRHIVSKELSIMHNFMDHPQHES